VIVALLKLVDPVLEDSLLLLQLGGETKGFCEGARECCRLGYLCLQLLPAVNELGGELRGGWATMT